MVLSEKLGRAIKGVKAGFMEKAVTPGLYCSLWYGALS